MELGRFPHRVAREHTQPSSDTRSASERTDSPPLLRRYENREPHDGHGIRNDTTVVSSPSNCDASTVHRYNCAA